MHNNKMLHCLQAFILTRKKKIKFEQNKNEWNEKFMQNMLALNDNQLTN